MPSTCPRCARLRLLIAQKRGVCWYGCAPCRVQSPAGTLWQSPWAPEYYKGLYAR